MDGTSEVYTSWERRREFGYANVRKATYRGSMIDNDYDRYLICSDHQHDLSVFKFCIIWGVWLALFADALLFDHMLKSGYEDGVDTIQDMIDRDMSLGRAGS